MLLIVGCRKDKQWFLVRHREKMREFILAVIPKGTGMLLSFGTSTEKYINELFSMLDVSYNVNVECKFVYMFKN